LDFEAAARATGFTAAVDRDTLLAAARLRFAPWRTGPETAEDLKLWHRI
jgi:N-acetylmuramoyl-L-alanine amidase